MRKVLLTNPENIVADKLPDKKTLPNVTAGFMKGFFGPGMTATITTPEEPAKGLVRLGAPFGSWRMLRMASRSTCRSAWAEI